MLKYNDSAEFEHKGFTFVARVELDECMGAPWKEHDGHGPVSDWRRRNDYGRYDKAPGERLLYEDHGSALFYDFAEAIRIAKREGWGSAGDDGLKAGEKALRAVERDYDRLRRWCENDWCWVSVLVTLKGTDYCASLSGIESDEREYLAVVARELADEVLSELSGHLDADAAAIEALRDKLAALDED